MYNTYACGNGININSSPEPAGYLNGASRQTFVTPPLPTAMPKMIVYHSRGVIYIYIYIQNLYIYIYKHVYVYVFVYKAGSLVAG